MTNAPGGNIVILNSAPITGFEGITATVQGTGEFHITNSSDCNRDAERWNGHHRRGGNVEHDYE